MGKKFKTKNTVIKPKKEDTTIPEWRRLINQFYLILAVRIASVYLVNTEFVPDEAWQSTQVAYNYVYGRGHLTWEWIYGLRSHLYPVSIAGIYYVLKLFGNDTPYNLVVYPRIFQAVITSIGEYFFFLFCVRRYGMKSARWSLGCVLTCWFTFYCGSRTITNTTEMALNYIAIYLLEMDKIVALCGIVGLNFMIRPTAIIIWIPQILHIFKLFFPIKVPQRLPFSLMLGIGMVTGGTLLDSKMFGRPVVAWFRFIKFNFLEGQSAQFGEHHFLWYFYSGLISITGPNILVLIFSLWLNIHTKEWTILVGFISCMSLIRHKEIRFLLPVLPYVFSIMGNTLAKSHAFVKHIENELWRKEKISSRRLFRNVTIVGVVSHVLAAMYFCGFHQGAVYPMSDFINQASREMKNPRIWIMTSCYAVPIYTYLHNPNATFEFMTCGPKNMNLEIKMPNFERFTRNETELQTFLGEKKTATAANVSNSYPPDFVMCFSEITQILIQSFRHFNEDYEVCRQHLHAQFGDDRGMLHVLCHNNKTNTSSTATRKPSAPFTPDFLS